MGLNESYFAIRGQILLMQPLPTVRKVYSMLFQEEKQREVVEGGKVNSPHAINVLKPM
ncbi:hypothetical protein LguiB_018441 [Lonicera macranthoides]